MPSDLELFTATFLQFYCLKLSTEIDILGQLKKRGCEVRSWTLLIQKSLFEDSQLQLILGLCPRINSIDCLQEMTSE